VNSELNYFTYEKSTCILIIDRDPAVQRVKTPGSEEFIRGTKDCIDQIYRFMDNRRKGCFYKKAGMVCADHPDSLFI